MKAREIEFEAGYIVVTDDGGRRTRHTIANMVRPVDVPDVPIASLTLLTKTADLLTILIKTLIERDILDENFEDGYDLQHVVDTLEDDLSVVW